MKGNAFKRIGEYSKWKDILNFQSMECIVSLIIALCICIYLIVLDVYNQIFYFIEALRNIALYIASALIGMLGLVLSGVAIIISLLQSKNIQIEEGNQGIIRVLVSFEYIALIIGGLVICFFSVYFGTYSNKLTMNGTFFYILAFLLTYVFSFVIFYIVALIGSCIKIFYITKIYDNVIPFDRDELISKTNEVRIDYILSKLQCMEQQDIAEELIMYADKLPIKDKEKIKVYLKKHYNK